MLIVLEGLDGAGKSTQVRMFREYLATVCPKLEYIHFPRYDAPLWGGLIGKFPQLVALLFAGDRHDAAPDIRRTLREGGTVLLDRYVYSNIAYQCAKLPSDKEAEELREWINNTEYGQFDLPRPDLNIFLDVPIGFVEQSLSAQRGGSDRNYLHGRQDIHEADINFQRRVRDMYRRQAALDPHFIVVDCSDAQGRMLPPDAIFDKIKAVYESYPKD
jgi:dTMP kinase